MDTIQPRYLKGYEPVILDPDQPYEAKHDHDLPTFYERVKEKSRTWLRRTPIFLALAILLPVGIVVFFINSSIQTVRSKRRIILHEKDEEGQGFGVYRIPLVRNVRAGLEDAFEITNAAQEQEYLPGGSGAGNEGSTSQRSHTQKQPSMVPISEKDVNETAADVTTSGNRLPESPTLALTSGQFAMIKALDDVGFRKYPVHIHQTSHSHAAIIVRTPRAAFEEGKIVIKHWLEHFSI